jgi:HSP20 family protein
MSTIDQLREGMSSAWDTLMEGWQRLYQHARGAIIRFHPASKSDNDTSAVSNQELSQRSVGWGVMAAEVFDDDDKILVRLEAPGMEKDDFDLQVTDEYMIVRGEKRIEREQNEGHYHITERAYGSFERAIPLADNVDADKASASYKRGVLEVKLPKFTRRQRKKITVNES